ncbi:Protein-tyrosine phosphatase [Trueperella bialowiezensis]|uniref:Protein-tyrosine phosphatase n=2 Tax=Trueperella bialowiezensis TaxID=312285 RepID=A0A448PDG2_9ACTO|nr:Protein-tyrosine phosphatase [Trueperella bialowiezensis]
MEQVRKEQRWKAAPGVVEFPSGRRIRGRSWRQQAEEPADLCIMLTTGVGSRLGGNFVTSSANETIAIDWPDYRLPRRTSQAHDVLKTAWERSASERVEIVCRGGVGRTGTALAIIAVLEGMDPQEAIDFIKQNYAHDAVETPAQRAFVRDMGAERN